MFKSDTCDNKVNYLNNENHCTGNNHIVNQYQNSLHTFISTTMIYTRFTGVVSGGNTSNYQLISNLIYCISEVICIRSYLCNWVLSIKLLKFVLNI